jgi:hypothetical protein
MHSIIKYTNQRSFSKENISNWDNFLYGWVFIKFLRNLRLILLIAVEYSQWNNIFKLLLLHGIYFHFFNFDFFKHPWRRAMSSLVPSGDDHNHLSPSTKRNVYHGLGYKVHRI